MEHPRHLAILACKDARLIISKFLGFNAGEAHIIRTEGGNKDTILFLYGTVKLSGHN